MALDGDHFSIVDEPIDHRHDAGSIWKDVIPFGKIAIGGDDSALCLVAAADKLEEQVGVAVGVGQVSDLIDDKERRSGVVGQAPSERGGTVDGGEFAEQLAGTGEQGGVTVHDGVVGDIASDRRFADTVWADEDGIGSVADEVEAHESFDRLSVASCREGPFEVYKWLEAPDPGILQTSFQAAPGAFVLFPVNKCSRPAGLIGFLPVSDQPMQVEACGAIAVILPIIICHRGLP